ncbi:DUF937 domain-containing protein [Agromyces sp. NPDC058104]|uniref:DUF937 domain-containing protein n=1 Tax=Agromyces sp. NPDC058104 TaxID=3346342 RepID=UPI0036DD1C3C
MPALDDIIADLPIGDIAAKLGVDEATAKQAVGDALPALLAGMGANAADPAGAASLEKAVASHDPKLVEGGVNLADVDEADGEKIVKNVFGGNTDQVVQALDKKEGGSGNLIGKLLPILAPIVMSFLAKQFQQKQGAPAESEASGGGIGDLLGGLLGGGSGGGGGSAGGIDLGGILGGLLGGGSGGAGGSGSGGGLGDLLGGLLGGGKR